MPIRVAVVVSQPIQHFCPFYRYIAASGQVTLKVYFASSAGLQPFFDRDFGQSIQWQADLVEGFDHEFLTDGHSAANSKELSSIQRLPMALAAFNPDAVVVYGYAQPISRAAIRWTKRWQKKLIYISDSELRTRRAWWKIALKRAVLPKIFSKVDAFLTVGDSNESYYAHYGVGRDRLFRSPFPVDLNRLHAALQDKEKLRREIRIRYSLPDDALVALTVGKLTPRKRTVDAVKAVCSLWKSETPRKTFLLAAGDGALKEMCENVAKAVCSDAIRFAGFVPVTDLPAYYVSADMLLHPSSEDPHPLAISEAVTCGLPCIVSDRVGSVGPSDDVRPGVNGWEHAVGDYSSLASRIRLLASSPELLRAMSGESLRIGQQRDMKQSFRGFMAAVHFGR